MKYLFKAAAIALAAGGVFAATGAAADADILKAKGCLGCHDWEKKKVGPSYKDIAAKEKGKEDQMVAKISGAKGHPKVNATEAEVREAIAEIMKHKY